MDDLEKIDRLFALKEKGALSGDEFAREKAKVFAHAQGEQTQPVTHEITEADWQTPTRGFGYVPDQRAKIATAFALCGLVGGAVWWAIGLPKPFGRENEPLEQYIVGSWVPFRPNETAEMMCATDMGESFAKGGGYSAFQISGRWTVDGETVKVHERGSTFVHRIERISDVRAKFHSTNDAGTPEIWDSFRCSE